MRALPLSWWCQLTRNRSRVESCTIDGCTTLSFDPTSTGALGVGTPATFSMSAVPVSLLTYPQPTSQRELAGE